MPVSAMKPAARYLTFPSFNASSAPMAAETLTASSAMGAASVTSNCKPKTSNGTAMTAPPAPVSPSITPTRAPRSAAAIETETMLKPCWMSAQATRDPSGNHASKTMAGISP